MLLATLTAKPPLVAAALTDTVQASVPAPVIDELEQESPVSTGVPVPLRLTANVLLVEELLTIVSAPLAAPAVVGSNFTVRVAVWLGLSVSGKVAPEREKPAPLIVTELMTAEVVPVADSVIDCEVAVFTATLPKLTIEELRLSDATAAFNCSAKVRATPPAPAVSVTAWALVADETVAEKLALVAPVATVTVAGTVTAALLLARFTAKPPLAAAALRLTVQTSVPAPFIDELEQESAVSVGVPVPLRLTVAVPLVEELLLRVSIPPAAPADVGSN